MQFVYTVSSFLHIMIRHNVDFCKNEPLFIPLIIFHLNCILLLMMKMNKKQFLFHSWKIRAEGQIPLSACTSNAIQTYKTFGYSPVISDYLFLFHFCGGCWSKNSSPGFSIFCFSLFKSFRWLITGSANFISKYWWFTVIWKQ